MRELATYEATQLMYLTCPLFCHPQGGADGVEQPDDEPAGDLDPEPAGRLPAPRPPLRPPHARRRLPALGARPLHRPRLPQAQARQHHAHPPQLGGGSPGRQEVNIFQHFGEIFKFSFAMLCEGTWLSGLRETRFHLRRDHR